MPGSKHENILIEGIREGNEKIFDYVFYLFYSGLVVYANKHVQNEKVAEDIVQDFFVKLWTNRKKICIKQTLKSYAFSSVKNSCIDYFRHEHVKQKNERILTEKANKVVDDNDFHIETELREHINAAIEKLPPKCREIFIMNRFEGLKPVEIAGLKNISVRTVETHIGKALKIMKSELRNYLPLSLVALILGILIRS
jgi:RNA polymerase sigma-70 factor (ECF subfamily)